MSTSTVVRVLNPIDGPGYTSPSRAARICRRGRGHMASGILVLHHDRAPRASGPVPHMTVMQRARLAVICFVGVPTDTGFARYPLPDLSDFGPRFPALARMGAGL